MEADYAYAVWYGNGVTTYNRIQQHRHTAEWRALYTAIRQEKQASKRNRKQKRFQTI